MSKYLLLGFSELFRVSVLIFFEVTVDAVSSVTSSVETAVYKIFSKWSFQNKWCFQDENCNSSKSDNRSLQFTVVLKTAIIADILLCYFKNHSSRRGSLQTYRVEEQPAHPVVRHHPKTFVHNIYTDQRLV